VPSRSVDLQAKALPSFNTGHSSSTDPDIES